jgi:purine-binding chemotaxis protein CheW
MNAQNAELHQYLTFTLGEELFAMDISTVREIIDDKNITKIPRMPPYMRGVINIRGQAVPVIDLRLKFGMSRTEMDIDTCVIITEVSLDAVGGGVAEQAEPAVVGALADSVQEVIELTPDNIAPAPRLGAAIDTRFIRGMAQQNDRFIIVLEIDDVFSGQELSDLALAGSEADAAVEIAV